MVVSTPPAPTSSPPSLPASPEPRARIAPAPVEGTEMIGEYQDSGFREPHFLVRRPDGQIVQLTRLLYLVLDELDGVRDLEEVAARAGERSGRTLDADLLEGLIEGRLRPAGLLSGPLPEEGSVARSGPTRPDPLLFLRFRVALVPERVVWVVAGLFRAMFRRLVVVLALAAFVAVDVALLATGALGQVVPSLQALVGAPELVLAVLATVLVAGILHECGHVAACRYSGARPGVMGVGIYLVWPAMYSTVTDAYRLSRRGRLRVDLAGVYFNAVTMAGLGVLYLSTGSPWVLVALIVLHIDTVWQFLPSIRLDGYYILSDLVGVPDLFSRLGPILRSAVPGRAPDPRVTELKPWTRRVVTAWVVVVIPSLIYLLIAFLSTAPHVLPTLGDTWVRLGGEVAEGWRAGAPAAAVLAAVSMVLLVLPWVGVSMILGHFGGRLLRRVPPTARPWVVAGLSAAAVGAVAARVAGAGVSASPAERVLAVTAVAVVAACLLVLAARGRVPAPVVVVPLLIVAVVGQITDAVAVPPPAVVGAAWLAVVVVALTEIPDPLRRRWVTLVPVGLLLTGGIATAPVLAPAVAVGVVAVLAHSAYRHCRPVPWSLVGLAGVAAPAVGSAAEPLLRLLESGLLGLGAEPGAYGAGLGHGATLATAALSATLFLIAFRNRPSPVRHARPARVPRRLRLALPRGST